MTQIADKETHRNHCFYEYLKNERLFYPVDTIENILLSIKVKPFLIFSGGTGTGKTKIAQMYGRFISSNEEEYAIANTTVTLNKADTNNGFTLSADDFFNKLPYDGRKADGTYKIKIGKLETDCTIKLSPRLWYKPNVQSFRDEINDLKKQGKNKETLTIFIPKKSMDGSNYEIIPVGSNWTENRFIIGYKNVLTSKYSSTKSLDLIVRANKNTSEPYLLVLDEMNLSHVERYFSDILSAMESGEAIELDSDGTDVPKKIELSGNLIIIGTVNVDETTYAFSPKVLDRANVIEFETIPVSEIISQLSNNDKPDGDIEYLDNCTAGLEVRQKNATAIKDEICSISSNIPIFDELICDLDLMQKMMDGVNLSFGFRTINEIFRFMYVSWVYKNRGTFVSWKRFFDAQIKQKILPKIHGNLSIKETLQSLFELCSKKGYVTSANKLEKMIETLEKQRYVSFNN